MKPLTEAALWQEVNHRDLGARLRRIRALLEKALDRQPEPFEFPAPSELPAAVPLVSAFFNLSAFETDLLLLCAGVEMDSAVAALCAELNQDARRPAPTFAMALSVLPEPHWSALSPNAPLRFWRLIEPGVGETLARSPLRIDERILHFMAGVSGLDARLEGLVQAVSLPVDRDLPGLQGDLQRAALLLSASEPRVIALHGQERRSLHSFAAAVAERCGLRLFSARASDLPTEPHVRHLAARLWQREALLTGGLLCVDVDSQAAALANAQAFVSDGGFSAFLASEAPVALYGIDHAVRISLEMPGTRFAHQAWEHALGGYRSDIQELIPKLTAQFHLPPASIRAAVEDALSGLPQDASPEELSHSVWQACRRQARPGLDDLAQHIETGHAWRDIVLPKQQQEQLHQIAAHVAQRQHVYEDWGFGAHARSIGTSVIFSGDSGTGKTLAAEILANELQLDLYRVDLSSVVSKYIGETEKNLRRIFHAAEYGGAILLFDEADALFGKRSEVKDSHDRYANIEVSYLLQQMEIYRGLAILTTNMLENFDRAFLRRVRFVVHFPFPNPLQRAQIWERVFPAEAPIAGLDLSKLARLNLAGGHIRNIAVNGAFLAAQSGEPIGMQHLLQAARSEYQKLDKPLPDSEVSDWGESL